MLAIIIPWLKKVRDGSNMMIQELVYFLKCNSKNNAMAVLFKLTNGAEMHLAKTHMS